MDDTERIARNRARWDELVPLHEHTPLYDTEAVLRGKDPLKIPESELVGDVRGHRLAHLQCHFGLDTIGWARRGARATGLDFSGAAVAKARGHMASMLRLKACRSQLDAVCKE